MAGPKEQPGTGLILMRAKTEEENRAVRNQTGGRCPFFAVTTDDGDRSYEGLKARGDGSTLYCT